MSGTLVIFRRELASYFATPVAYVFIFLWLVLSGFFTFAPGLGNFFGERQASLLPFFFWHPWLYLMLIPALSMRLWAEERKAGTIELLLTLPLPMGAAVLGKFLAAWTFTGIALASTFPLWITVNGLGSPDNGVILAGYLGSLLMAGSYLAIGACVSAVTRNQVIALVLSVAICLFFVLIGHGPMVDLFRGWLPVPVIEVLVRASFLTHYQGLVQGVVDARTLVYFVSIMAVWLFANALVVNLRKAS